MHLLFSDPRVLYLRFMDTFLPACASVSTDALFSTFPTQIFQSFTPAHNVYEGFLISLISLHPVLPVVLKRLVVHNFPLNSTMLYYMWGFLILFFLFLRIVYTNSKS